MGGSSAKDPKFPKEIGQMWGIGHPIAERIGTAALTGTPLWDVPAMPEVPAPVMPSAGWFQSISPEVRQGLWAPYQEAGSQLMEQYGSYGQRGSGRAGYSGAALAGMGTFGAQAAKDVGLQAWQMTAPQMMDYRNQMYESALQQRGDYMQQMQAPYTLFPSYLGGMGQLPYYATPARPSPWVGAAGGAMAGGAAGSAFGPYGTAIGAAAGGIYGYYASR